MQSFGGVASALGSLGGKSSKHEVPITCVSARGYKRWAKERDAVTGNWLAATDFRPDAGSCALVPDPEGRLARVILGLGEDAAPPPWTFAALVGRLPKGRYAFDESLSSAWASDAALGWALASYRFTRYRDGGSTGPVLVWPKHADREEVTRVIEAIAMGRDLINTPAEDMGPEALVEAGVALGEQHGAATQVLVGPALLNHGYPAIHAVGRASARAPRLFDLRWGDEDAPRLTLVGKGVCFDSGGLDLKNAAGMKLMKKDMGGAAMVLALAHAIMGGGLRVRLRVLIPAVENSVSGSAFRPGDVLPTRKGLTVEVGNTDAEGRLVLCDALAEADAEDPDLVIDAATLTGAARVALGTELPALFGTDEALVAAIAEHGRALHDPLWPMPLFEPYRRHLDSPIADLANVPSVAQGGAITAALFLREFVAERTPWIHIDTMAWNTSTRPGRPLGGEVLGLRAVLAALRQRYA